MVLQQDLLDEFTTWYGNQFNEDGVIHRVEPNFVALGARFDKVVKRADTRAFRRDNPRQKPGRPSTVERLGKDAAASQEALSRRQGPISREDLESIGVAKVLRGIRSTSARS